MLDRTLYRHIIQCRMSRFNSKIQNNIKWRRCGQQIRLWACKLVTLFFFYIPKTKDDFVLGSVWMMSYEQSTSGTRALCSLRVLQQKSRTSWSRLLFEALQRTLWWMLRCIRTRTLIRWRRSHAPGTGFRTNCRSLGAPGVWPSSGSVDEHETFFHCIIKGKCPPRNLVRFCHPCKQGSVSPDWWFHDGGSSYQMLSEQDVPLRTVQRTHPLLTPLTHLTHTDSGLLDRSLMVLKL